MKTKRNQQIKSNKWMNEWCAVWMRNDSSTNSIARLKLAFLGQYLHQVIRMYSVPLIEKRQGEGARARGWLLNWETGDRVTVTSTNEKLYCNCAWARAPWKLTAWFCCCFCCCYICAIYGNAQNFTVRNSFLSLWL